MTRTKQKRKAVTGNCKSEKIISTKRREKSTMTTTTPFLTVDILPNETPRPRDSDDQTEVASSGSGKYRKETREISLNWCLEGITDRSQAKKIHSDILATMLTAFPGDLTALDNTNQELQFTTPNGKTGTTKLTTDAKFTFHLAPSAREQKLQRWYCVHKIISTKPLSTLKNYPQVLQKMKVNKVYVNEHHFKTETWDVAHIGFLQGINI